MDVGRRLGAAVATAGLVALLLAPGTTLGTDLDRGPIAITVTRDGTAVPHATVVIRSMAPQSQSAASGSAVETPIVARGTTNGAGRLQLTPSVIAKDRLNDDGIANLIAEVTAGSDYLVWHFPLQVTQVSAAGPGGSAASHRSVDLRIDVGSDPGAADMKDSPSKWQGLDKKSLTASGLLKTTKETAAGGGVTPMDYCYYYWTDNWIRQRNMIIGNLWSWSGAPMSESYDNSVTSTLGIAAKATNGTFSLSGTMSFAVTSGSGGTVNGLYNRQTYNQVSYRELVNSCYLTGWYEPYETVNILYPIYYWPATSHPRWSTCGYYTNGSMYKTAGSNLTFGAGIDLGPISVSASTSWKSDNKLTWNFGATRSALCGSTTSGWVTAPEAEAHQG